MRVLCQANGLSFACLGECWLRVSNYDKIISFDSSHSVVCSSVIEIKIPSQKIALRKQDETVEAEKNITKIKPLQFFRTPCLWTKLESSIDF